MKLICRVSGLLVWILTTGVLVQSASGKDAGYRDNVVLAKVGGRTVTKWGVMRSLERQEPGFVDKFGSRSKEWNRLKEKTVRLRMELREAKRDGRTVEVQQLEDDLLESEGDYKKENILFGFYISRMNGEKDKQMNDLLLIEQVKANPLYREPPGVIDFYLSRRVKAKEQAGGLASIIRDLQEEGRTMAMLREEILDNWILGQVEREMSQQVIVSPKQVRDRYQSEYASKVGQQFNVADLYVMRIKRDKMPVAKVKSLAKGIGSRDDFMSLFKEHGKEGDGPQGLISLNDGGPPLDRKRKGTPPPGTPAIAVLPTVESEIILKDAHFKKMMAKVAGMKRGQADHFYPIGGKFNFILFVNDVIRDYTIPLGDQRKKIYAELFNEALQEVRRRKIEEARKIVFTVDYLKDDGVSLLNNDLSVSP